MGIKPAFRSRWIVGSVVFAVLVVARVLLEPKPAPPVFSDIPLQEQEVVRARIRQSTLDRQALLANLTAKQVILVGESHFIEEPQAWLRGMLSDLHVADGRGTILLLELPLTGQAHLDRYMASGAEQELQAAFGRGALPYKATVRWARAHPEAVTRIVMCDANPWHTGLMRLLLTDTRNDRMARRVADVARENPGARIVVYGGALHMMKGGRYMYDSDTRRPVGQRLPALGLPAKNVAVVWLFAGSDPVEGLWNAPGALDLSGPAGNLPIEDFESAKVFGVTTFHEIVDYAIHLGPATPVKER